MSEDTSNQKERLWSLVESGNVDSRADALNDLGELARQEEDWEAAKGFFLAALDLYTELGKFNEASRANYSAGFCHYRLDEHEEAVKALSRSLADSMAISRTPGIAYSAGPLADSFVELRRIPNAINAYKIAVSAFSEIGEAFFAGINAMALGELYGQEHEYQNALEAFVEAFNYFQTAGEAAGSARAKDRMASALIELGDRKQALSLLEEAKLIFEKIEDPERVAFTKYRIGWTLNLLELHNKAQKPLRGAIHYFRSTGNSSMQALVELQLCESLFFGNINAENHEAFELTKQLISYFDAVGEPLNTIIAKSLNASIDQARGNYRHALRSWKLISREAKGFGYQTAIEYSEIAIVECNFALGHTDKATQELDSLLKRLESLPEDLKYRLNQIQNATQMVAVPIPVNYGEKSAKC